MNYSDAERIFDEVERIGHKEISEAVAKELCALCDLTTGRLPEPGFSVCLREVKHSHEIWLTHEADRFRLWYQAIK